MSRLLKAVKQAIILGVVASVIGLGVNIVSPNAIEFIGNYRSIGNSDGPIVPPSAEVGDPPFVDIGQAQLEYTLGTALFIDAREEEEFNCGTIPGSVNIPFEEMPDGDLTRYLDSAMNGVDKDRSLIIFCSGEECDLSLHLGRLLQTYGYTQPYVFFGGSREWEKFGLKVERRSNCEK